MSRESLAEIREFFRSGDFKLALIAVAGPIVLMRVVAWLLVTFGG